MAFSLPASICILLATFLRQASAQAAPDHEAGAGCVHLEVIHSTNAEYFGKRAVEVSLANRSDVAYYAKLNIGSPPQSVYVQLDTGSFELWVNPTCSALSGSDAKFCQGIGHYDTTKSSSATSLTSSKQLRYGIGSANISYFKDDITLPGSTPTLKQVQFGVATSSEDEFSGILGIGYGVGIATRYNNFIDELAAQNATKGKVFSLALGSKDAQSGVIVFGGVDTSKFSGALARLPIIPAADSPDEVPRYWINMNSLTLSPPSGKSKVYPNSSIPVFLDSGATMTLLPQYMASAIAADFGATQADQNGFYEVSCDLTKANGTLDFAFNGTTVRVPYRELIRTIGSNNGQICFLGIQPSSDFTLLGDTFLRSAYAVFDLDNNVVWMTQAANCGSTPAALDDASLLATVSGVCAVTNAGLTSTTTTTTTAGTSTATSATTASTGMSSAGAGAGGAASGASGSPSAGNRFSTVPLALAFGIAIIAAFIGLDR